MKEVFKNRDKFFIDNLREIAKSGFKNNINVDSSKV
jgi:hypothetical protein